MPYHATIEKGIDPWLAEDLDVTKKKMFGGRCYLFNGNMGLSIYKDYLIVRCGETAAGAWLEKEGILPFDITGRPMKAWLMADETHWRDPDKLRQLLHLGMAYARKLPPK